MIFIIDNHILNYAYEWMCTEDIALFMKQILELPKNMEVSEVVINRKSMQ